MTTKKVAKPLTPLAKAEKAVAKARKLAGNRDPITKRVYH